MHHANYKDCYTLNTFTMLFIVAWNSSTAQDEGSARFDVVVAEGWGGRWHNGGLANSRFEKMRRDLLYSVYFH